MHCQSYNVCGCHLKPYKIMLTLFNFFFYLYINYWGVWHNCVCLCVLVLRFCFQHGYLDVQLEFEYTHKCKLQIELEYLDISWSLCRLFNNLSYIIWFYCMIYIKLILVQIFYILIMPEEGHAVYTFVILIWICFIFRCKSVRIHSIDEQGQWQMVDLDIYFWITVPT